MILEIADIRIHAGQHEAFDPADRVRADRGVGLDVAATDRCRTSPVPVDLDDDPARWE